MKERQSWTFRVSRAFWHREDITLGAKGIASMLLSFADKQGVAFPTTPQLAKAAGIAPNTADKYLDELRDVGEIAWEVWKDEHGHRRRRFYLDTQHPKFAVCQHPKFGALTSTTVQAQRLFVKPSNWDGLGGQQYDGRRTMHGNGSSDP